MTFRSVAQIMATNGQAGHGTFARNSGAQLRATGAPIPSPDMPALPADAASLAMFIEELKAQAITGFRWAEVTTATQQMAVKTGYVTNRATLVTLTLPATAIIGDILEVVGSGDGGWLVAQNANQRIYVGRKATTVGVTGSIASRRAHSTVRLVCIVAGESTKWDVAAFS